MAVDKKLHRINLEVTNKLIGSLCSEMARFDENCYNNYYSLTNGNSQICKSTNTNKIEAILIFDEVYFGDPYPQGTKIKIWGVDVDG